MQVRDGESRPSRRTFIAGTFAFVITILSIGAGILRFLVPNVEFGKPKRFKAGMPQDFPDKSATYLADQKVFIIRDANSYMAVSAVCTHLGCTVRNNPDNSGFSCPCHGSKYHSDGTNFAGPAPRPLDAYEVSLGPNGELIVDKRTLVSRKEKFTV